ncbi:DUF1573 domain-containing protein [Aggregatilinea lenta]|uniref:DUF1573 domain-containing protein n=1 Tax=Aggregatilinea lenta TaxID=913108 RepID=UPI0013C31AD0|nr:DUF1573 domain-containing protein [Aggregatilinea lenta]
MAQAKKSQRRKNGGISSAIKWTLAIIAVCAAVVFALVLAAPDPGPQAGQTVFDSDFEPEVTGAPRVSVVEDELIDYGDVKLNTTIQTSYTVRNLGDEPLMFVNTPYVEVIEGCCPPQAQVSAPVIEPGHEGTVSFSFMMHEGMGGPHEFRVHLQTNDPAEPDKQLTILSNWVS